MKHRCADSNDNRYGGRGISFDVRWESFSSFLEDMGERPAGKTLDRINNSLGYSKQNCQWATPKQQQNNRRNNVMLEFNGQTMTEAQWAERLGCNRITLKTRRRRGWTVEETLSTPIRKKPIEENHPAI